MRVLYLLIFFLACGVGKTFAQTSYKGIKQISVFTKGKTDKAPQLEYELSFDQKGNKTKYHSPSLYCTEEWAYNAQNKITKYDVMCGESFGNGTTVYQYNANTTIVTETTGAYERITIDSLDTQKRVVSRTRKTKVLEESYTPSPDSRSVFVYDNQKVTKEFITTNAGKTTLEYAYKGDSLQSILRTHATGKKDTLLLLDFYRDSGRRSSKRYPITENDTQAGYYVEYYRYDEKGRLISITKNIKSAHDCPNPKFACIIEKADYLYKNDQLFQVERSYYTKGNVTSTAVTLYANGLEREMKSYNIKGELESVTTYKIQKW
jgi:hypothetical protein